ncbi:MAG TPA: GNAT family N-acetyltransferase, partial [Nitrospira sp.]|nr:GNAT family N-acetyltransferase [Nitrospira sp.]
MKSVRPLYIPPLENHTESGSLILRDGSTAAIRPAEPSDAPMLQQFVDRLSLESRRHRFFSESLPSGESIATLCNSSDPHSQFTLIVTRAWEDRLHVIAAGSYWAKDRQTVEVAMAVDDGFHGKGLGTLLLERLALVAIRHGFTRLWAVTHADNLAMRDVFRESGFTSHEAYEGEDMEVELSLIPTEKTVARVEVRERLATTASLRPFFHPTSVAIVGASRDPKSIGYRLLDAVRTGQFQGAVYPVNPHASEIAGVPVYPSVLAIPGPVDLAIVAVPRPHVLSVVDECAEKGVRALVVITAGFSEVGAEGAELQRRLVETVRQYGMRMIGPNCFGI